MYTTGVVPQGKRSVPGCRVELSVGVPKLSSATGMVQSTGEPHAEFESTRSSTEPGQNVKVGLSISGKGKSNCILQEIWVHSYSLQGVFS